jgi:succinate dehydrogenase hydrophobic anchor subunit
MNDFMKDLTGIALAIVGVAILYTLVNPDNKTSQVISASASGFSQMLSAAMGGGAGKSTLTGYY